MRWYIFLDLSTLKDISFRNFIRSPAFVQFSAIIVAGFKIELEEIADKFTSHSPSLIWDKNNRNLMSKFLVFFELRNVKGGYFRVETMKIHLQFLIESFFIITVSVKFIQDCIKFLWEINSNSAKKNLQHCFYIWRFRR